MRGRCAAVVAERDRLTAALRERGLDVADSQANFVWLPVGERTGRSRRRPGGARRHHPAVRRRGLRVTVGTPEEDDVFLAALDDVRPSAAAACRYPARAGTRHGDPDGGWFDGRRASSPCALRHPADGGFLPPRQLPGCAAAVGRACRRRREAFYCVVDLHAITLPTGTRRSSASNTLRLRRAAARPRRRPRPQHAVRAEPRARAPAAVLGPGVPDRLRRGQPDDAVQGQEPAARAPAGSSVGLFTYPVLHGGRHPRLPGRPGAGGRRPAPAPRADPRPGDPVQRPLRRDVHRAEPGSSPRRRRGSWTCSRRTRR